MHRIGVSTEENEIRHSDAVFEEMLETQLEDSSCYHQVSLLFTEDGMKNKYYDFNKSSQYFPAMFGYSFVECTYATYFVLTGTVNVLRDPTVWTLAIIILCILSVLFAYSFMASISLRKWSGWDTNSFEGLFLKALVVVRQSTFGALLILRAEVGQCEADATPSDAFLCNSMGANGGFPLVLSFFATIYPLLVRIVFRQLHWEYVLLCWVIMLVTSIAAIVIGNLSSVAVEYTVVAASVVLLLLHQYERQNVTYFLSTQRLCVFVATKETDAEKNAERTKVKDIQQMIGNVAHDLKTPLASVLNGIEVVVRDTVEAKVASEACDTCMTTDNRRHLSTKLDSIIHTLKNMKTAGRFMNMAINRCIEYTKVKNGLMLRPNFESVNIRNSLNLPINCVRDLQTIIEIEIETMPDNISSNIITDKHWLQENLLSLLSNAVKYSNQGKVIVRVYKASIEVLGNPSLQFEVEDTGIGMSEEVMATLFQPFKKAQRLSTGGTGLGLFSLAKRVEALAGKYGVMKRRDGKEGSLFWFCIPYRPAENDDVYSLFDEGTVANRGDPTAISPEGSAIERSPPKPGGLSILLVDDSMMIVKMVSNLLRREGHAVSVAFNGAEALQIFTEYGGAFDMCLMDFQMPVMDGFEATERMRKFELNRRAKKSDSVVEGGAFIFKDKATYIIGCSANTDSDMLEAAYKVGMDDCISKPLSITAFYDTVKRYENKYLERGLLKYGN